MTTDTVSIANPTLALLSESTFFVDGESRPGVITVQRWEDDHIEITIQPLAQLPYPINLEVIIDSNDLASIKRLLEAQDAASTGLNAAFKPFGDDAIKSRLAALEATATDKLPAHERWLTRQDDQLVELADRLYALESPAPGRRDGGHWIPCPFCADDLSSTCSSICSACNDTRRIWEMPCEDGI